MAPFHAKITGQLEICRCVSTTVRAPAAIPSSVCVTASGQSIATKSALAASPRPTAIGSSACELPPPRHGSASRATHSPPMRASMRVPMPLAFVRICCDGSMRPRNESAAYGQRPLPGASQRAGPPAVTAGATPTGPRASITASSKPAGTPLMRSTRPPCASRIASAALAGAGITGIGLVGTGPIGASFSNTTMFA